MNILVISSMYPSVNNPVSGSFVHSQVQELVRQGCQAKVLSPVPMTPFPLKFLSRKWAGFQKIPWFDLVEDVEIYYPRYLSLPRNLVFGESGKWMYAGIKKLVNEISKDFQFDLIHAHGALPDGFAAMEVAEKFHKPYLVTIHGADLQKTVHFNPRCKEIIGSVIVHSASTILVSNKLRRIAERQFGNENKLRVISNGIDPLSIDVKQQGESSNRGEDKIILSVSNLIPTKGIDLNLQAVKRLAKEHPEIKYLVIGDGPERKPLEELAMKLGLSERVEFLGQLHHDQVMSYMAGCDIFSLPSWEEGFGIVYLEAMAHGKPVIGCRGEGLEDFVADSETGFLVNPKDIDSLSSAINYLIDNPHLISEVGRKAKEVVLNTYTWEKNAQRTIQLYQEIISDL